jgi:hypothetical protein
LKLTTVTAPPCVICHVLVCHVLGRKKLCFVLQHVAMTSIFQQYTLSWRIRTLDYGGREEVVARVHANHYLQRCLLLSVVLACKSTYGQALPSFLHSKHHSAVCIYAQILGGSCIYLSRSCTSTSCPHPWSGLRTNTMPSWLKQIGNIGGPCVYLFGKLDRGRNDMTQLLLSWVLSRLLHS